MPVVLASFPTTTEPSTNSRLSAFALPPLPFPKRQSKFNPPLIKAWDIKLAQSDPYTADSHSGFPGFQHLYCSVLYPSSGGIPDPLYLPAYSLAWVLLYTVDF